MLDTHTHRLFETVGPRARTRRLSIPGALLAACLLAASVSSVGQETGSLRQVPSPSVYVLPPDTEVEALVIKFLEGTAVRLREGKLTAIPLGPEATASLWQRGLSTERLRQDLSATDDLVSRAPVYPGEDLAPAFSTPPSVLDERKARGERLSGRELADLTLYFRVRLATGTTYADVAELVAELNALPSVEIAYAEPPGLDPQVDVPPPTPDFEPEQGYLNPAPEGVDARYAWTVPGGTGEGVRIIDVEQGWNPTHEDLPPLFFTNGTIRPQSRNHGTAVLGVLVAADNGYGVTGISHGAQAGYSSHFGPPTPADAINTAATALGAGDLIIIEIHLTGPANGQVCNPAACGAAACDAIAVEFWQANYDAIETATANGIVVVEAAGNGVSNLDDPAYGGLFDRSVRDSGAILVAGGRSADRGPTCYTNWGSRIDVQGWGQNVTTTGYGGLFNGGGDEDQRYLEGFNGTSAATPVVTGAAAAVQGAVIASGAPVLTSVEMRAALRAGGTPQLPHAKEIGPLPNLRGAIDYGRHPECQPPAVGEWVVTQTCVVASDTTTPSDVEVRNGASLIVLPQVRLQVDLNHNRIRVRPHSRLLVRPLGRVN